MSAFRTPFKDRSPGFRPGFVWFRVRRLRQGLHATFGGGSFFGRAYGVVNEVVWYGDRLDAPWAMARLNSFRKKERCEGGRCFRSVRRRRKSLVDNPKGFRFLRMPGAGRNKQSVSYSTVVFDMGPPDRRKFDQRRRPSQ
jgi:hypothetical protein